MDWTPALVAARVAEIIRQDPKRHQQDVWIDSPRANFAGMRDELNDAGTLCGTTACAAGWAAILVSPAHAVLEEPEPGCITHWLRVDGTPARITDAGREALGLNDFPEAHWLFDEDRTTAEVLTALDEIAAGHRITIPEDDDGA